MIDLFFSKDRRMLPTCAEYLSTFDISEGKEEYSHTWDQKYNRTLETRLEVKWPGHVFLNQACQSPGEAG